MGHEQEDGRARIEAEAADWLLRLESRDADMAAFTQWRDRDPAHAAAFARLDAAWARADRAAALRPPGPPNADLLEPEGAVQGMRPSRRWLLRAAGIAGLGVAGLGGAALLAGGRASAETGVGERRAIRLPDGSLLDLNTDSRASWRFSARTRAVWLERGEAAIEVASDTEARPFLLDASGRQIELDRGVFMLRLRSSGAEVAVLRGRAELGEEGTIEAGRAARLQSSRATVSALTSEQSDAVTAWRRGEIVFDGDTLAEAVAEYNRYLPSGIVIDDPSIGVIRLGGRFATRDPEEFLRSLAAAFPVDVVVADDGRTHLVARGAPT